MRFNNCKYKMKQAATIAAEKDLQLLSDKAQAIYSDQDIFKFEKIGENEYYCKYDKQVYTLAEIEQLMIDLDGGEL